MIIIEIIASILGIMGAINAALFKDKLSRTWIMWIISNVAMIILFLENKSYILVLLSSISLILSINAFKNTKTKIIKSEKLLIYGSKTLVAIGILGYILIICNIFTSNANDIKTYLDDSKIIIEGIIFIFNLAGLMAITSGGAYSKYGWIWWLISNFTFAILMFFNAKYFMVAQQLCFIISGFIGVYTWWIKDLINSKNDS